MEFLTEKTKNCIDICVDCEKICKESVMHCLMHGKEHADPRHIGFLKDCAGICRASAEFMITKSFFSKQLCALCSKVCIACADSCNKFKEEFMKECAKVCKECSNACKEMSQ